MPDTIYVAALMLRELLYFIFIISLIVIILIFHNSPTGMCYSLIPFIPLLHYNSWNVLHSVHFKFLTHLFHNLKVYLKSRFILNGVCVLWRGWIDLDRLDGSGKIVFDQASATVQYDTFLLYLVYCHTFCYTYCHAFCHTQSYVCQSYLCHLFLLYLLVTDRLAYQVVNKFTYNF